jgi:hypothetical protein
VFPAVTVPGHMTLDGIECSALLSRGGGAHALFVEERFAAGANWSFQVEAVVLMNGYTLLCRDVTAPLIVSADAVRVASLNVVQEVRTEQIPAIVCLAESLQVTVSQWNGT